MPNKAKMDTRLLKILEEEVAKEKAKKKKKTLVLRKDWLIIPAGAKAKRLRKKRRKGRQNLNEGYFTLSLL
ncbi:MAG: hypothetical protein AABX34_05040 [Nanoarchaeota archaeon]